MRRFLIASVLTVCALASACGGGGGGSAGDLYWYEAWDLYVWTPEVEAALLSRGLTAQGVTDLTSDVQAELWRLFYEETSTLYFSAGEPPGFVPLPNDFGSPLLIYGTMQAHWGPDASCAQQGVATFTLVEIHNAPPLPAVDYEIPRRDDVHSCLGAMYDHAQAFGFSGDDLVHGLALAVAHALGKAYGMVPGIDPWDGSAIAEGIMLDPLTLGAGERRSVSVSESQWIRSHVVAPEGWR